MPVYLGIAKKNLILAQRFAPVAHGVAVFNLFLRKERLNKCTTSGKPTLSRNFGRF